MKQIVNITDITEYLYCPRKVYLRLVKGVRMPPTKQMIFGMLRHKVFDIFNKNENALVSGIKEKISAQDIKKLYENLIENIVREQFLLNRNLAEKFKISSDEFFSSVKKSADPEIKLRIEAVMQTLEQDYLGKELWRNLHPKYLTEFRIESRELGLRGRIDRVKFNSEIMPYEIKTREGRIFESDRIQLAGYAMLLESEFNRQIEKCAVEILGKTEEVILDKAIKSRVLEIAEIIRNLKEENAAMPSNFKKCESCQLKHECPDI